MVLEPSLMATHCQFYWTLLLDVLLYFDLQGRDSNSTKCVKGTAVLLKYSTLIDSEDQIKKNSLEETVVCSVYFQIVK